MLSQGAILQGRYQIIASLGHGGMGSIYRARDTRLDVDVAIKEMRPQPDTNAETLAQLRKQFRQEAAVLARLNHPNLVRVTDFFEEGGNAYLVMDFLEGETLAQWIVRQGALPEAQVVNWGRQLLGALAYCHKHGVLHRDIKPQNILLRADGRAVLIDFGLVKLWDARNPQTQTVMRGVGTPEYAPPEQYGVTDQHTTPRSDLYALGATLYHALTGERPLSATDRMALPENFKMPRMIRSDINPQTEFVILKAMALKVSDRWDSAEQMLGALNPFAVRGQGVPVYSPPPSATAVIPGARSESQPIYTPPPASQSGIQPIYTPPTAMRSESQPIYTPTTGNRASQPLTGQPRSSKTPVWLWGLGGLVLIVVVMFLGCGLLSLLNPRERDRGTATPRVAIATEAATPTRRVLSPTPHVVGFEVRIRNKSSDEICYVLISSSEEQAWGEDWLDDAETIVTGASRTFDVPEGEHDVMVQNCDGATLGTAWQLSDDATVTVGGSGLVKMEVYNESSTEICYVYISPSSNDNWGEDWLGAKESIAAQEGVRFFYLEAGTYDLLAQDCDNNDLVQEQGVSVSDGTTWTITD